MYHEFTFVSPKDVPIPEAEIRSPYRIAIAHLEARKRIGTIVFALDPELLEIVQNSYHVFVESGTDIEAVMGDLKETRISSCPPVVLLKVVEPAARLTLVISSFTSNLSLYIPRGDKVPHENDTSQLFAMLAAERARMDAQQHVKK